MLYEEISINLLKMSNNVVMCKQLLLQWTYSVCVVTSN